MKLWHDDIRKPPRGWEWARTNAEAYEILLKGGVDEASLDHDLGLEGFDENAPRAHMLRGRGEQTGMHLVSWMIEKNICPPRVWIHSWNHDAAKRMAINLNIAFPDSQIIVSPYDHSQERRAA